MSKKTNAENGILEIVNQLGEAKADAKLWKKRAKKLWKDGRRHAREFEAIFKQYSESKERKEKQYAEKVDTLAGVNLMQEAKLKYIESLCMEFKEKHPANLLVTDILAVIEGKDMPEQKTDGETAKNLQEIRDTRKENQNAK